MQKTHSRPIDHGEPSLCHAAARGDLATARRLLESGCDPDIRDSGRFTPLMLAAKYGQGDMIRLLGAFGPDLRAMEGPGRTAAWWAAEHARRDIDGSHDALLALVEIGADLERAFFQQRPIIALVRDNGWRDILATLEHRRLNNIQKPVTDRESPGL